ncbi:MAG: hypothetical protein NC302_04190 [Bacteroidales bacterium]|nr:hypothetical protein [Bacteroidales bacterium]
MIREYGGLFFLIYSSTENIIYNKITDPATGRSCYPDILVRHGFREEAVTDGALYADALPMQQKYGTSCCFFLSASNDSFVEAFAELVQSAYSSCAKPSRKPDEAELARLCDDLALSQTMRASFAQLMRYCALIGDPEELMRELRREYSLPVSGKNEGKKIYEAVRAKILR